MDDLRAKVAQWVAGGLISQDQGDAILAHERPEPSVPEAAPTRVPLVTEAIGYLGGGLATIAAAIFMAQIWDELQPWAKLALVGLVTAILAVSGALIRSSSEPAVQRLASFLWLLSSAGVAFFVALASSEVGDANSESVFLLASLAASAYSLVLWLMRRRGLQQLALFAALIGLVIALLLVPKEDPDAFFVGLAVWGVGLIWAILSWGGVIRPARVGIVAGAVAMLVSAQVASLGGYRVWGLWLGVVTAIALLATGVIDRNSALLGLGALGVIVFTPQLVLRIFEDTLGAPLALLVTGLGLVVGAVIFVRYQGDRSQAGEVSS